MPCQSNFAQSFAKSSSATENFGAVLCAFPFGMDKSPELNYEFILELYVLYVNSFRMTAFELWKHNAFS